MRALKPIYNFLFRTFSTLLILSILWPKSCWIGIQSLFKKDNHIVEKEYQGQKILLIALYQKSLLRNDIKQLLIKAKKLGFYIIGVNTLKLTENIPDFFDVYIERFNYGRDFGSYKTGFNYIFDKKTHLNCPRLLMCNDSVYYESTRTERFLLDLMTSDIEALGATENHEINHHLGSFCIAIGGRILAHHKFIQFWKKYKNSELRPVVIHYGEMRLSCCLKQLVLNQENFSAVYDMERVSNCLIEDEKNIKSAFTLARRSNRVHWPQLIYDENDIKRFAKNYLCLSEEEAIMLCKQTEDFFKKTNTNNIKLHPGVAQFLRGKILEAFRAGSQIHQNNIFLLYLGMPIIKLDGFFRGVFSEEDVLILTENIPKEEARESQTLLFSKAYGKEALFGWKKFLYNRGYL